MACILIVDDERNVREVLARLLEREGHEVLAAEGGEQALEILRGPRPVDLVLLDLYLGTESGMEVLRRVRESPGGTRVALMTGLPTPETAIEAMKLGADEYLLKPLRAAKLRGVVLEMLGKRRSGEPPPGALPSPSEPAGTEGAAERTPAVGEEPSSPRG